MVVSDVVDDARCCATTKFQVPKTREVLPSLKYRQFRVSSSPSLTDITLPNITDCLQSKARQSAVYCACRMHLLQTPRSCRRLLVSITLRSEIKKTHLRLSCEYQFLVYRQWQGRSLLSLAVGCSREILDCAFILFGLSRPVNCCVNFGRPLSYRAIRSTVAKHFIFNMIEGFAMTTAL